MSSYVGSTQMTKVALLHTAEMNSNFWGESKMGKIKGKTKMNVAGCAFSFSVTELVSLESLLFINLFLHSGSIAEKVNEIKTSFVLLWRTEQPIRVSFFPHKHNGDSAC